MKEHLLALPHPDTVFGHLRDELAVRIGNVAISSEAVQYYIGHLCIECAGNDLDARAKVLKMIRKNRSDHKLREMTKMVVKEALSDYPSQCKQALELVSRADELSEQRNEAIHNAWVFTTGKEIRPSTKLRQPKVDQDWQEQFDRLDNLFRSLAFELFELTRHVSELLSGHLVLGPSIPS